jgi:hypothetical protein
MKDPYRNLFIKPVFRKIRLSNRAWKVVLCLWVSIKLHLHVRRENLRRAKNKERIDKACVHCVTGYTTGEFAISTTAPNYTTIMFHLKAGRC